MKKIVLMLAMMFTLTTTWAFTGEEAINEQALTAFKKQFAGATDAAWSLDKEHYKVAFSLSDQRLFAFYSTDGEFIAVTRYLSTVQLPLYLRNSLKNFYSNAWVSDLFEVSTSSGTTYYVTIENADTKTILKSFNAREWSVYQKEKKV